MLKGIGTTEILVIALIIILLFGGKKIPEFFRGVGEAIREFKKSSKDKGSDEK
jgi:sec-independent protein translocase protein TatA